MNGLDPEPTPTRPATPQCRSCGTSMQVLRRYVRRGPLFTDDAATLLGL